MALTDLKDVYFDQLQDLCSATSQSLDITVELGRAASDAELSKALIAGSNGIAEGRDTLMTLCADHGIDPAASHCHGMEGLAREARKHGLEADFGNPSARDAMLIAQYQRMVHYAIAGYGCLLDFANRLGFDGDARALKRCLDETYGGDDRMSRIARGSVNPAAV